MRLAVIGGGWAGLAAAVEGDAPGAAVTLFEMAPATRRPRARRRRRRRRRLDNGQHILHRRLQRDAAPDAPRSASTEGDALAARCRFASSTPDGLGLRLPPGPADAGVRPGGARRARLVAGATASRCCAAAAGWARARLRVRRRPSTVAELARGLPRARARRELIEPLCVAALNTPRRGQRAAASSCACCSDALFGGPGSRRTCCCRGAALSALAAAAGAAHWLERRGRRVRLAQRVERIEPAAATPLAGRRRGLRRGDRRRQRGRGGAPDRAASTRPGRRGPRRCATSRSSRSMRAAPARACPSRCWRCSHADDSRPAQFVFDLRPARRPDRACSPSWSAARRLGRARPRRHRGGDAGPGARRAGRAPGGPAAKRCARSSRSARPSAARRLLDRPPASIAPGLAAAGDYVDGPYPATLEGAVRSGQRAAARCRCCSTLMPFRDAKSARHAKDRSSRTTDHPGARARLRPARRAGLAPGSGVAEG